MPMDEMTADEFKEKLASLLNEDWFAPIGITLDGKRRMVVVPADVFRSMRTPRRAIHVSEMSEQDVKEIAESKMPDGFEHLDEELKDK